jgi:hypothetical protein
MRMAINRNPPKGLLQRSAYTPTRALCRAGGGHILINRSVLYAHGKLGDYYYPYRPPVTTFMRGDLKLQRYCLKVDQSGRQCLTPTSAVCSPGSYNLAS